MKKDESDSDSDSDSSDSEDEKPAAKPKTPTKPAAKPTTPAKSPTKPAAKKEESDSDSSDAEDSEDDETVSPPAKRRRVGEEGDAVAAGEDNKEGEEANPQRPKHKQGTPFRRVDPSLASKAIVKDNSYYGSNVSQWGAKAADTLDAVRGRDFRHEKTKKKRGTYQGGHIDVNAIHSKKFADSDEEDDE